MSELSTYIELTKPRLLPLVLFSGLPALVMAGGGWPGPARTALILGGIALAAGSANALNSYLERDRDREMARTRTRPLPAGRLAPRRALAFGLALGALGPGLLWAISGAPAAGVALAGILFYVFIYTLWLKPRTSVAAIVGGAAGAVAPLIADAAVRGHIGAAGWLVFAIIFVWQPPHFWSIALYRRREYEAAGFPLLIGRIGEAATRRRVLAWTAALLPISLAPWLLGLLSPFYAAAALVLGVLFLASALQLVRDGGEQAARHTFRTSLVYMLGLCSAMLVDLARLGWAS